MLPGLAVKDGLIRHPFDLEFRVRTSGLVRAESEHDTLELRHDAHSRRAFALGAVRGAGWLAGKSGAWEFREIFEQL